MTSSQVLLERIAALRARLAHGEQAARPAEVPPALAAKENPDVDAVKTLERRVAVGYWQNALLDCSVAEAAEKTPESAPAARLTGRSVRLLQRGRGLLQELRRHGDEPFLENEPLDPLSRFYRETAAMVETLVRAVQAFPETPSLQVRLCDGLEAMVGVIAERIGTLAAGLESRRTQEARINRLCDFMHSLLRGQSVSLHAMQPLADEILDDVRQGQPLRFYRGGMLSRREFEGQSPGDSGRESMAPTPVPTIGWGGMLSRREFEGQSPGDSGRESMAPVHESTALGPMIDPLRFAACHGLIVGQVLARLVIDDPEWAGRAYEPVLAGLLHDLGMSQLPAELLSRPGPLSDEQRRLVESHTVTGAELLRRVVPYKNWLAEAAVEHHERVDGTGYPAGMRGDSVAPLVRLVGVCDVYAALCSPRPYRAALETRTALTDTLLLAEQGGLDRFQAEKLLNLSFYPPGSVVELSDGGIGVVSATHKAAGDLRAPARPVLTMLLDGKGRFLPCPTMLDLLRSTGRNIVRSLDAEERQDVLGERYPELV